MKRSSLFVLFLVASLAARSQVNYDSITISHFLITGELYGKNWSDTLKAAHYHHYVSGEKTVWVKPARVSKVLPAIIHLLNRIKTNGTADVAKCFIPRHSINYYKEGKLVKFLQVCFECDGLRFSDDRGDSFVKSISTREKQMQELKTVFTNQGVIF